MAKPCNADTYRKATAALARTISPKVIVEVGVYAGALSRMLAEIPSREQQFIVDSWKGDYCKFGQPHMDDIAKGVIDWAATDPKIQCWRLDSKDGATKFAGEHGPESIDFWHTDGDHSLAGITGDIKAWLPLVRSGGLLSGDNFEIPEVAKGVRTLLPGFKLGANGRLWYWTKP
jgi:predicted O-methyltransferase YrrM